MPVFSASAIFPVSSPPIINGSVLTDEQGTVLEVSHQQPAGGVMLEGIICPGFVNSHCHLELSHLKGHISEKAGMTGFIKQLLSVRPDFDSDIIRSAARHAENEMLKNGIVAVGDISNDNSTFRIKAEKNILYHTFIEVFNFDPAKAVAAMEYGRQLRDELLFTPEPADRSRASVTPHAPYTLSEELLQLVAGEASRRGDILSIHNQESSGESELFASGSGPMHDAFIAMGIPESFLRHTGKNSLRSTLPFLTGAKRLLLVHNTFTSKEDISFAENAMMTAGSLYWCTCPNANLYIEGQLPDYRIFLEARSKLTVGTDSLASNWSLSILDELKTIASRNPWIPLETLLTWATKNGAEFLGFEQLGVIEEGKKPGLNLITHTADLHLTKDSQVRKLI